jgi:putative endopeptidase
MNKFWRASLLLTGFLQSPLLWADSPAIPPFGVELSGRDLSINPGADFFEYAGGQWMKTAQIPSDRTSWGPFTALAEAATNNVHGILEEALKENPKTASANTLKIGNYYAAFLDQAAIEKRGLAPLQPTLAKIAGAHNHLDVIKLLSSPEIGTPSPINMRVTIDQKNPDRYIVAAYHGGLALPDRDFYLRDDAQFKDTRQAYQAHIERLLNLAHQPHAKDSAAKIVALETEIAKRHWPRADRRDRERTYNLRTLTALSHQVPDFPWEQALDAAGLPQVSELVVSELSAMEPLAQLIKNTPVETWKAYLTYHAIRMNASVLPKAIDDEVFAFYGHTLNGQQEQKARWKRAVDATNSALGEAVGQAYVARYFPPESKAQMLELVENLRKAYADRIANNSWMTPETKRVALEKLHLFRPKIGYPDQWRDYSGLKVSRTDAFGNLRASHRFEWQRDVDRLAKPTDRNEWGMTPQTVNAYYNSAYNEIVFPAAILQPPFFDPKADPAVNYGGIGGVIGHEMGHGFDDQGSKSDAHGVLHNWWTDSDVAAFKRFGDQLAAQYDQFEALPGIKVNGRLTLGENFGDLGGLTIGYLAYHQALKGTSAPVLEGITGDQRFFLAWAQVWRTVYKDQALRNQVLSDPHSPARFRVNGAIRNVDAWYDAFGIKPSDPLYVAPADRVHPWQ